MGLSSCEWQTLRKIMGKIFSCPFITHCKFFHCKSGMLSELTQINKKWARHPPADWGSERKRLCFSCTQCWITQYNLMYISSASVRPGGSPNFAVLHQAWTWLSCLSQSLTAWLVGLQIKWSVIQGLKFLDASKSGLLTCKWSLAFCNKV